MVRPQQVVAVIAFVLAGLAPASQAAIVTYTASLSGPAEAPPNASPGTGSALVTVDTVANTLRLQTTFSGLQGTVVQAHIHCCTATPLTGTVGVATPVPTFPGFPSGVTSGSYDQTFNLTLASSYNPAFVTANVTVDAARAALLAGLESGRSYLNIHTTTFPGGEIRGFLVPEPGTLALLGTALLGVFGARRARRLS